MSPALVLVGAAAALGMDGMLRWIAMATMLAALPSAWVVVRGPEHLAAVPARACAVVPALLVVVASTWMLWPLVIGEPPASRDHAIHYFQARILVDEMLPSGRLSGWTERFNHGFAFGEGYPTLGVLWVSAAHLVSFGAIGLRTSYAWGLLGVWALSLWGVWRIAAAVATDVRVRQRGEGTEHDAFAHWAGCAGAMAWLVDPGAARQGGWNYLMFHGVWPQQLSTALWIAAVVVMLGALRRPSLRSLALAAILLAASILAHPFGLLTAAASAVGIFVVAIVAPDATRWSGARVPLLLGMHVFAAALAAAGVATFFAAAGELGRSPVAWSELGELAARLATGELLAGTWAWTGGFAIVGVALALWSGRAAAWLAAGLCCGLLLLGSREAITVLRLDLVASGFKNLQFPRFAIALKPVAFALSGVALAVVVAATVPWLRAACGDSARRRLFVAVVIAPGIAAMLGRADLFAHRPVAAIDTLAASGLAEAEQALREALIAEREVTPGTMRVAFLRAQMGGGTYPLFAIGDAGVAAVLDGHVATVNFDRLIERRSPQVLRRLGVTHIIHDRPLPDGEADLARLIEPVGTFGPYALGRFAQPPDTDARFVDGDGTASVVEHGPSRRVYDVQTGGATFEVPQAPSARWQFDLDGEPLESTTTSVRGGMELLAVFVPRSGRLTLTYVTHPSERRGRWISLVAGILALGMLPWGRPLGWCARVGTPGVLRGVRIGAIAVAGIGVAVVVRRQRDQLAVTWHEYADTRMYAREEPPGFVDDLTIAGEITVERSARPICDGVLGKDALVDCEEGDYRPNPSFVYLEPYLYRCVSFGIAPGDTATVKLGEGGDEVVGFASRSTRVGRGRGLRFGIGRRMQLLGNRRADLYFAGGENGDGAVLTLENGGDEVESVCVAAARFAGGR